MEKWWQWEVPDVATASRYSTAPVCSLRKVSPRIRNSTRDFQVKAVLVGYGQYRHR